MRFLWVVFVFYISASNVLAQKWAYFPSAALADNTGYFILTDGTLWAGGRNDFGQLGQGDTIARTSTVLVDTDVIAVSARGLHALYFKGNGTLWGMGDNRAGLLVSLLQALTQVQEQTLSFAVKLVVVSAVLLLTMTWVGNELLQFTDYIFSLIQTVRATGIR